LSVQSGGTFQTAGDFHLRATGSLIIEGGTVKVGWMDLNGGTISFLLGSLDHRGDLVVGDYGMLGSNVDLTAGKALANDGATWVEKDSRLTISGGNLKTGELRNQGEFVFNGGNLLWTDGWSRLENETGGSVVIGSGARLTVPGDVFNSGEISLGGGTAILDGGQTLFNSGVIRGDGRIGHVLQNELSGEVRVDFASRLLLTEQGNTNRGRINLSFGGTLESPNGLVNEADGVISGDGILRMGKMAAGAGLMNYGKMNFSGTTKVYGDVWTEGGDNTDIIVSGGATLTFYDDVYMYDTVLGSPKPEIRAGSGSRVVYFGLVKGNVYLTGAGTHSVEGTLSPGFSPGYLETEASSDLELASAGTFSFDLAGILRMNDSVADTTGYHTAYDILETLTVLPGGTIDVNLVPISAPHASGPLFAPINGQQFALMTWAILSGDPSTIGFNFDDAVLGKGLSWEAAWGPAIDGSLVLSVVPEPGVLALLGLGAIGLAFKRRSQIATRRGLKTWHPLPIGYSPSVGCQLLLLRPSCP